MRALPVLVVALVLCAPALAEHESGCEMTTSQPEIDTGPSSAARVYIDNDHVMKGWSIWVYLESNGVDGLQRHDETYDDTCGHDELGDTIIF